MNYQSRGYPISRRREALQMYADGLSVYRVAEALGMSRETVRLWARDAGILRAFNYHHERHDTQRADTSASRVRSEHHAT